MTDWYNPREGNGVNEPAIRAREAKVRGEAFLSALLSLIESEAKRARVSFDYAQTCLANGVDPLKHRKAAA